MTRHAFYALALLPFGWLTLSVAHALTVALVGWLLARPVLPAEAWMALLFAGVFVVGYAWWYARRGELV